MVSVRVSFLSGNEIVRLEFLDRTIVRVVNECEQMGVMVSKSRFGEIMGPPADNEYPVEPFAVEIINPSPS